MEEVKIIDLRASVLEDNDADAERLRGELKEKKTFFLNVMSSPGSGKTSVILQIIARLKDRYKIGVMEADIDSDVDAKTVQEAGVESVQVHTGGMCHLDADMSRQGMRGFSGKHLDLVILENVGNLVCPAEFDTGACRNLVILSVPEGDDKPLKYPLMFQKSDAVLINKIDAMPAFDFDLERAESYIGMRHPGIPVFPVSARTGEGMDEAVSWLAEQIEAFLPGNL